MPLQDTDPTPSFGGFGFRETYWNAFLSLDVPANEPSILENGVCATYLDGVTEGDVQLERVRDLLATIEGYVGIRDHLAMTFALDYEREDGDPNEPQTDVGALRANAKPYNREAGATDGNLVAAGHLADKLCEFVGAVECYQHAEAVCAVPPSDPARPFHLAGFLAKRVSADRGMTDASSSLITSESRSSVRLTAVRDKLNVIHGSMRADSEGVADKMVLLIDDLYQSGVTMNYAAMMLLGQGAKAVFGLACEKTCRNDDNVSAGSY